MLESYATQAYEPHPYGWRTRLSRFTSIHYGDIETDVREYSKRFGQMANILR
jgi:hypothetical protein